MEKLLFKILEREITNIEEITSIEMVLVMSEFNDHFKKEISIFDLIECKSLKDLYDLYN